jgi:hypothetical protein
MTRRKLATTGFSLVGLTLVAVLTSRAQERAADVPSIPIQEALNRPFTFPFAQETTLEAVAEHLAKTLQAKVVLDRAALDRLEIGEDDKVVLKLEGVRLKVGLRLLLDQLAMTYRVEPEDNLLILTDTTGSADPIDKIVTELKALHRDVHDLQDSVDEIRSALDLGDAEDGQMHKPTIIEEVPARPDGAKPKADNPPGPATKPRHSGA